MGGNGGGSANGDPVRGAARALWISMLISDVDDNVKKSLELDVTKENEHGGISNVACTERSREGAEKLRYNEHYTM